MKKYRLNRITNLKNRLIYDMCSATAERRETTTDDVKNDIVIKDYKSSKELYIDLLDLAGYDKKDEAEIVEEVGNNIYDKIEYLLGYFGDPGDGSPNILYCIVDGVKSDNVFTYDSIEGLNLKTCTEEDVINAILESGEF